MKTKVTTRIIAFLMMMSMLITITSCGTEKTPEPSSNPISASENSTTGDDIHSVATPIIDKDREGNEITLPQTIEKIISMGPSNTEILVALGCGDKILASDMYSENVEGIPSDIPLFSMMEPDGEQIINLQPDVIIVTGMSKAGDEDPLKVVADAGICILYIPSSTSIDSIKEDIRYLSTVVGAQSKGEELITNMEREIDHIKQIGDTITDKKKVYFEISAAPYMYSFGKDVFLNEILDIIGAQNILQDQESWVTVADEVVVDANPDVILTSVNYIENPTEEIKARPGWSEIAAVQNDSVYYIDTDASNRPSQNIVKALKEMAKAIYPDKY